MVEVAENVNTEMNMTAVMANPITQNLFKSHFLKMTGIMASSDMEAAFKDAFNNDPDFQNTLITAGKSNPENLSNLVKDTGLNGNKEVLSTIKKHIPSFGVSTSTETVIETPKAKTVTTEALNTVIPDKDVKEPAKQPEPENDDDAPVEQSDSIAAKSVFVKEPTEPTSKTPSAEELKDANIDAGKNLVSMIGRQVDGVTIEANEKSLENTFELYDKSDLMEAIGVDFKQNTSEILTSLSDMKKMSPKDFSNMMEKHPEIMKAVIPIAAAADPAKAAAGAMDAMGAKLKAGIVSNESMTPDEKTAANDYIDSSIKTIQDNPKAMAHFGEQLSDVETSGQLLDNINDIGGVAGSFDRVKMVMDDMTKNPTEVMDLMASPRMMVYAGQRWSDDIISQSSGVNVEKIQEGLMKAANGKGIKQLEEVTGVDIGGMLNGMSQGLPGFADSVGGHMKHFGAMAANGMVDLNVTSSWMGGFDGGGNMGMGGDMFASMSKGFSNFGTGMGISSYAQICNTDSTGNVRVGEYEKTMGRNAGMDEWTDNQKDLYDRRVDENNGSVTDRDIANSDITPDSPASNVKVSPYVSNPENPEQGLTIENVS